MIFSKEDLLNEIFNTIEFFEQPKEVIQDNCNYYNDLDMWKK